MCFFLTFRKLFTKNKKKKKPIHCEEFKFKFKIQSINEINLYKLMRIEFLRNTLFRNLIDLKRKEKNVEIFSISNNRATGTVLYVGDK